VRARRAAGAVEISVTDTGSGVTAQDAARIFEPFYSTKPGAAGLGLCAARTIAECHGGTVTLVAPGGPGAEFVLSLPARE
jgi:signal transduction histidine kinase